LNFHLNFPLILILNFIEFTFFLDNLKEKTVTVALNKGSRENSQAKDKFKLQMANNPKFMDTLFELLSNSNVTMVEDVWQILTTLPLNKNLRGLIEKLNNIDGTEVFYQ